MLFVDYGRMPSDSKDFVLKSVLSDTYIVKQVIKCANRAIMFLRSNGPENVPHWLFEKLFDNIAQCYKFLKLVESYSCCPLGDSDVFYKKLRLAADEMEHQTVLIKEQFEGGKNV